MKQFLFFWLFFCLSCSAAYAQEERPNYSQGDFLAAGGGGSFLSLRDLGVSPIYYDGYLALGHLALVAQKKRFSYTVFGTYGYGLIKTTRLSTYQSSVHNVNYGGDFLHQVRTYPSNLQLKVGAALQGVTNVRFNPSFRNASSTVESINSLAASAKLEWFIQRDGPRRFLWLIPVRKGLRAHKLSYQLNIPLLTGIWSPAFPYLDDFTEGTIDYQKKNELKFGGWRFSNRFDYQYFLKNGNALQLSYNWEVFKGPNDFGRIEYGQHQLFLAFLIRLNEL